MARKMEIKEILKKSPAEHTKGKSDRPIVLKGGKEIRIREEDSNEDTGPNFSWHN